MPNICNEVQALQPDIDIIKQALMLIRPAGIILLVGIHPSASMPLPARSYCLPNELDEAYNWAASLNSQGYNLYFTCNITPFNLSKKATKKDILKAVLCWVDCDPEIEAHGSYNAARQHLLAKTFPSLAETASFIFDTGNGLSAFWSLNEPVDIDTKDKQLRYEAVNLELAYAFNGDHVQNCDRIMRLPGTLNYPSKKKLEKGYPASPSLSRILR